MDYVEKEKYLFDIVLRVKRVHTITHINSYSITGIQFVNLYDKEGRLVKNQEGDHCEINVMDEIKNSMRSNATKPVDCDSCDFQTIQGLTRAIYSKENIDFKENYKLVIGWSGEFNRYSSWKKRTTLVTNMINELKEKNKDVVVIGLNFDIIEE